jgi:hypothetical protein
MGILKQLENLFYKQPSSVQVGGLMSRPEHIRRTAGQRNGWWVEQLGLASVVLVAPIYKAR